MRYLTLLLLLCLSVWGLALPSGALEQGFMFWRNQGINLSGLIAVALMGALILMFALVSGGSNIEVSVLEFSVPS